MAQSQPSLFPATASRRSRNNRVYDVQAKFVSRLFWGRSYLYKNIIHLIIVSITLFVTISVLVYRVSLVSGSSPIAEASTLASTSDLLYQGSSIETVLLNAEKGINISTIKYTVKPGESLKEIADDHGVSQDTIRWASTDVLNPFTNQVDEGMVLTIPEINGVLYEVKPGDTLDSIISITSLSNDEANRFNVIELNSLTAPYTLTAGQKIFIPNGNLKSADTVGQIIDIPRGVFSNPLASPDCVGYIWQRGYLSYHNGIDLSRYPGCPIQAIANGVVTYAGWGNQGEGYHVKVDHGGGIVSHYYHGSGEFWVKSGDRVTQGQNIMMMGTSGNSTGVHLHISLFKNGGSVNPEGYIPY
jgi:LysM repeat protein